MTNELNALLDRPAPAAVPAAPDPLNHTPSYIKAMQERGKWTCFDDAPAGDASALRLRLEKRKMYLEDGREVPGRRALYNPDGENFVADVGARFEVIPPDAVADTIETVAKAAGGKVVSPWQLGYGRSIGANILLPKEHVETSLQGRKTASSCVISISCPNDGTGTFKAYAQTFRYICRNQYHMFAANSRHAGALAFVAMRHTPNAQANAARLVELLGALEPYFERFGHDMAVLAARQIRDAEAAMYFERVLPLPEIPKEAAGAELKALLDKKARIETQHETMARLLRAHEDPTAWGAMNAATRWAQHERKLRGEDGDQDARNRALQPRGVIHELTLRAERAAHEMWLN